MLWLWRWISVRGICFFKYSILCLLWLWRCSSVRGVYFFKYICGIYSGIVFLLWYQLWFWRCISVAWWCLIISSNIFAAYTLALALYFCWWCLIISQNICVVCSVCSLALALYFCSLIIQIFYRVLRQLVVFLFVVLISSNIFVASTLALALYFGSWYLFLPIYTFALALYVFYVC